MNPEVTLSNCYIEIDRTLDKLNNFILNKLDKEKMKIHSLNELLKAHNPINILNKGYTIIQDKNENIISSKKELGNKEEINIIFNDGKVKGKIIKDFN